MTEVGNRILIVDDEVLNRELLQAMLRPVGYEVQAASNGPAALEILATGGTDLVLLDVTMPGMDGIEVCRRIRADARWRTLPVVFVTALQDRAVRIQGKEAGGDDFLVKPVDGVELKARVRNLLLVKAYHDLREQQREALELELERMQKQLLHADRLATLGTLASGVGHELNNVAAVFSSTLQIIAEDATRGIMPSPDDLAVLQRMNVHLQTHSQQLLALGRPGPECADEIDLCEVVRGTLEMLRIAGRTKHVEATTELPSGGICVTLNRTRIEQVLVNLIGNAADALHGVTGSPKRVRVSVAEKGNGRVACVVDDTGCGIPPDRLETIFEPYYTTKPVDLGTGLGLPVARRIVESFGGRLTVESRLGAGSRFTFDLPMAAGAEASVAA